MLDNPDSSTQPIAEQRGSATAAPPCAMVIFGAAGDLTKRLVVPALYNLANDCQLSEEFRLVGVDLAEMSAEQWRAHLTDAMRGYVARDGEFHLDEIAPAKWQWLTERMSYVPGDLNNPETYRRLGQHLAELDKTGGTAGNRLFYLAVADRFFGPAIAALGAANLAAESDGQWRRVIIEKPFGHDLPSAKALNAEILKTLRERQIYRIDHFLGKETVQNIMALRFANGLFEPLWNRQQIDHVQITVTETIGVEQRGMFYEKTGALRDMVPNHLFQLLAMTAMEPPISFDADAVRAKKTEVIGAIKPLDSTQVFKDVVRGQYDGGRVLGKEVRPYRHEPDVAPNSSDRDIHCVEAEYRQLALGWRAVLLAYRKMSETPIDRDRHPLSSSTLCPISRHGRGANASQLDDPSHSAG
jgi:glucose-6-phosphate 1-dehydrogenase